MEISKEQLEGIKSQLIEQIETTLPEEKKTETKEKILSMSDKELKEFIIQNNLLREKDQKCIFCSIVSGEIDSYKINENQNAIAVLEINPISKGHTIVIPKPHVQEISNETKDFAKKISLILKEKLSAKEVQIKDSEMFEHKILSLIPIYDGEPLEEKRNPISKEELKSLQESLMVKEEPKMEEIKKDLITDKNTWLPKRFP